MKEYITARVTEAAHYIIEKKATVRDTAKKMGVSKSTIHKDVSERLGEIDRHLSEMVREILDFNLDERHLRGGESTKQKYNKRKKEAKASPSVYNAT